MSVPRLLLTVLIAGAASCAGSRPSVKAPASAESPEEASRSDRIVRSWIERHRAELDSCYYAESLTGNSAALSTYAFRVQALPGWRNARVSVIGARDPEQRALTACVALALERIDLPQLGEPVSLVVETRSPID